MTITNPRTSAVAGIISGRITDAQPTILVVGCGSGKEAAVLSHDLNAKVIGIDIVEKFDAEAARAVQLQRGDATALEFPDASFDIVFSYHALEHIPDHHKALDEMNRVLKPAGTYCIGTPNRARILGYLGGGSTMAEKISWNIADWRARFRGRFRNEFGAHAGYTASELRDILLQHFSTTENVTVEYYKRLYARRVGAVNVLAGTGIGQFLFPSVYFIGKR
jgi:ubiquinone/menaquinone biosynthesis C-methylase UbiE